MRYCVCGQVQEMNYLLFIIYLHAGAGDNTQHRPPEVSSVPKTKTITHLFQEPSLVVFKWGRKIGDTLIKSDLSPKPALMLSLPVPDGGTNVPHVPCLTELSKLTVSDIHGQETKFQLVE